MRSWCSLTYRLRPTLPLAVALLGGCTDPPPEVAATSDVATSEATTTGGPTPTTMTSTTMPGEDTMGTQGGTGMETTMGAVDTTVGVSVTDDGTTTVEPGTSSSSGESSGEPPPPPECMNDGMCDANEECSPEGTCVSVCMAWGDGNYGYCLTEFGGFDTPTLCGAGNLCVYWGSPITDTACSTQGCVDACDCPAPPATGNAIVSCGEITNPVGMNDCYLDCSNGEMCPDDMTCNPGGVCVTAVPELPVYGDCNNLAAVCAGDPFCGTVPSGEGACFSTCRDVGDCPAGPPTGTADVACGNAVMGGGDECYLDCSDGATCPDGMSCFFDFVCLWDNL